MLAARSGPVTLPSESFAPDSNIRPSEAGPRPIMGPVLPLVASSVGTDELLGGVGTRPASVDALVARTLVKGEPLTPPAGRADDFSWPRREVGVLSAPPSDPAVATVTPDGTPAAPKPRPKRPQSQDGVAQLDPRAIPPGFAVRQRHPSPGRDGFIRPPPNAGSPGFSFGNLFSRW